MTDQQHKQAFYLLNSPKTYALLVYLYSCLGDSQSAMRLARECNAQNTASKGKVPKYSILHYCVELTQARALLKNSKGRKKDAIAMI